MMRVESIMIVLRIMRNLISVYIDRDDLAFMKSGSEGIKGIQSLFLQAG